MNYDSFCKALYSELSKKAIGHFLLSRKQVPKNNGVIHDAVCIQPLESSCSTVVCLEPLYELYLSGSPLKSLCDSVLSCLQETLQFPPEFLSELWESEKAGSRIACRLISQKENELLLQDVPWIPFLDLAIVFFLVLKNDGRQQITVLLHNQHAEYLGLSVEELRILARQNTPSLFPVSLRRLEDLLFPLETDEPSHSESEAPSLFVLTNETGINGAACLLYDNVIKDFADQQGADVLILPSSVHEVLLIPDFHRFHYEEFRRMVYDINRMEVPKEDRLSDEIYLYSRSRQTLKIWDPSSPSHAQEKAE